MISGTGLYSLGSSPINISQVKKALVDFPDPEIANKLINGLEFGFKLNYSGPRLPMDYQGHQIVGELANIAREKIQKEIELNRIAGPFPSPPFPTFRVSPISLRPKKSSSDYRLIHNLSYPPNNSVNDYIDRIHCKVKYSSIDDAVRMIQELGPGALLAKCDIKSAFRLLRLSPSEFDLTGFKFENQYYYDKNLIQGCGISCQVFESFSTILHWYVEKQTSNKNILHYLDDFLFGGKSESSICKESLDIFQESCELWGVPLAHEKTVLPTEIITFLGIEFNTIEMIMRLPKEKLAELIEKINFVLGQKKTTLRILQSLIGSLNFACQVVAPGRAFCRRLIDATCNLRKPDHRTWVTKEMKNDLHVWLKFLDEYNGTTVFLDKFWSSNSDLELFTDSAGGIGFGIVFENRWAQATWPESWKLDATLKDITFLELFPVVVAIEIWGQDLRNKKILFHVDNESVVTIINKKSSKSTRVMTLVRKLVLSCLQFNILLKAEHIPGRNNSLADSLSRSNFQKFRSLCPTADVSPHPIPSHLWRI